MNLTVKTLIEASRKIRAQLEAAEQALVAFFEMTPEPPAPVLVIPPAIDARSHPDRDENKETGRGAVGAAPRGRGRRAAAAVVTQPRRPARPPKCTTAEMIEQIGLKLKQPFSAADLETATGCDKKKASNVVYKWKTKGWIDSVAPGAYERTDEFPGSTPAAKAAPVAKPAPSTPVPETAAPAVPGKLTWSGPKSDKPPTVGAAMKWLGRQMGKTFTREQMRAALLADPDWEKLMGQSPSAFAGNLIYWSTSGKLKRTGDGATELFEVVDLNF